jgi:anti-anti-sigma factor
MVVYAADDVLLQLTGHLDAEAADAFDDCVTTAIGEQPRRLVLDLSALGSMDLIGSDCLRKASESATGAGVHLVLDSPNESVLRVLESAMLRDGYSIR